MADPLTADRHLLAGTADFEGFVRTEQRRVFNLCCRLLQDREEADTATQDAFLKAYQALQRTENADVDDPAKWLTRIAVNTCLDRLRSRRWQFWRKRPRPEDEEIILQMAPSSAPDAEAHLFAQEIRRSLDRALLKLSDRQRAVFTLKHYEDHTLDQIAEALGLDLGTVKAHMSRAVAKLRMELQDLYLRQRATAQGGEEVAE